MQHIELKAKLQTIPGNAVFSIAFVTQIEISVCSLLSCMPAFFPANNALKKWGSSKKSKKSTSTKKVVVICKLVVACWASHIFSGVFFFVKVVFSKNLCYLRCVLCSKVRYSCFLPLSWQHSFRQMLFSSNIEYLISSCNRIWTV